MPITAEALAAQLKGELRGDGDCLVTDVRTIEQAGPTDLAYAGDEKHLKLLAESNAGVALVSRALAKSAESVTKPKAVILVDDAQSAALAALTQLRPQRPRSTVGISPRAIVSPTARIGENTNVHPGVVIGDDVTIGRNCDIHPNVVIGAGCQIGDDAILYPNCTLYDGVSIGARVILHAGVVIGSDGFGYRFASGRHNKLPHYGTVRIEDDVEVGANGTIDRAMIGATVIGQGTKIDNLVQVAHNVTIGNHNIFAALVGVAGSVKTGNYVVCAGQSGIADHVHLADGVVLGAKAAAHRNLETGRYHGIPVLPEKESIRIFMLSQKLPEMREQLKQLSQQVNSLTAELAARKETGSVEAA